MGLDDLSGALFSQRHRFGLWVPVWLGLGISLYFSLRFEPTTFHIVTICGLGSGCAIFTRIGPDALRILAWCPALLCLGVLLAVARAHQVGAPKLGWHYYGAVEGTIVQLDRSSSDKPRVTLSAPILTKVAPDRTPDRLRVSLHSNLNGTPLVPGARIMVTASLSPPSGPVEPGGFDFQRKAWFDGLGAVGYARAPPVLAVPPDNQSFSLRVFALRMWVSKRIQAEIRGQTGAFAAAIITGDRSEIDPLLLTDLRQSNLAHLLAISGLHMGLLTGFIFAVVRLSVAAVPYVSVRWQAKKIGAVVALLAGAAYLMISGANIATQRAYVMVGVMLIAVLLDRPAITLRAVAIAATLILIARPESLSGPGFQMSFAATTALVATFESLNRWQKWHAMRAGRFHLLAPFFSLLIASFVAGAATAPFSAFHFNQMAQYGLLANLLSVPVMSMVVMPFAVIAGILSLIGAQGLPFWGMGQGIDWILGVAHWIATRNGAVLRIPSGPIWALGLFTLGALIVVLWQGKSRWIGVPVAVLALAFWATSKRPDILITDNGRLAGIATPQGRALNRQKGNGFAASSWLENDGDGIVQGGAAKRFDLENDMWRHELTSGTVTYFWGKKLTEDQLAASCTTAHILIAPQWKTPVPGPCNAITEKELRSGGAVAIWSTKAGLITQNARQSAGTRLWNR